MNVKACFDDCTEMTPVHLAVRTGNEEMFNLLVDAGAEVQSETCVGEIDRVGLLHLAAVCNGGSIARRLIELGCDVNVETSIGGTPLFLAVKENCPDVVEVLVDTASKSGLRLPPTSSAVDSSSAGFLHVAVLHNSERMVRALVRAGCDVDESAKSEEDGNITPLYLAVDRNLGDMVRVLLELGCDVNKEMKDGFTVLHTAGEMGYIVLIDTLVQHGANVNKRASFGELTSVTPLHLAVMNRHSDAVRKLANFRS